MVEDWDNGFEPMGDSLFFPLSIINEIIELFMNKLVVIP